MLFYGHILYQFRSSLLLIKLLSLDDFAVQIQWEVGYSYKENIYSK